MEGVVVDDGFPTFDMTIRSENIRNIMSPYNLFVYGPKFTYFYV